jgi:hypothetical protein
MSPRRTLTGWPSRVFTVSFGLETPQHSLGLSSVKTFQSVIVATRLVDSWAEAAAPANMIAATASVRPKRDVMVDAASKLSSASVPLALDRLGTGGGVLNPISGALAKKTLR